MPDPKPPGYAAYTNLLGKWDSNQLYTAAKDVAVLRDSPGWEVLQQLLSQREARLLDELVNGPILTEAKYASQTSMVSGIRQSRDAAASLIYAAHERERTEQAEAERQAASG